MIVREWGSSGFPLERINFRAFNSSMDEVRTTPAESTGAGVISGAGLGERLRRAMVFGAFAGMAVGVLNFLTIEYRWKLADFFDILDFPFLSLDTTRIPRNRFYFGPAVQDADVFGSGVLCGIICYWTFIGWSLGSLFCLLRAGVIIEVLREKAGRWMVFFGACGGMFVGSLNFLAASNGWLELEGIFDRIERPIDWLITDLQIQYHNLPADPTVRFVCSYAGLIVYWAVIGFLVAWLVCAAWIFRGRIAAGKR